MFCFVRVWLAAVLLLLPAHTLFAQSARDLTLHEVLQVALQRMPIAPGPGAPPYQASSWLAGLPSVDLGFLNSDETLGTDETELSVNLPLLSPSRRKYHQVLQAMETELDTVALRQRELYLSGLIRESLWSWRVAEARAGFAREKGDILRRLTARQGELHAANAISAYALLLVQREQVVAEMERQSWREEAARWLRQFRAVTGLGSMPADIAEPLRLAGDFSPSGHPQLRALELGWLQRQQLLLASSSQAEPWNLALTAKSLEAGPFEENQYGLSLEIPLAFLHGAQQNQNSEWLEAARQYDLARDQLTLDLQRRWGELTARASTLQSRQELLARASDLSQQIAAQVRDLQASNELEEEIVLRRLMESIDSRAEARINELLIAQNAAMLRQAAGQAL